MVGDGVGVNVGGMVEEVGFPTVPEQGTVKLGVTSESVSIVNFPE